MSPSTKTKQTAFRIPQEILDGLHEVRERDGVLVSEQVRRALRAWLESRGVVVKSAPRRAATRRKA